MSHGYKIILNSQKLLWGYEIGNLFQLLYFKVSETQKSVEVDYCDHRNLSIEMTDISLQDLGTKNKYILVSQALQHGYTICHLRPILKANTKRSILSMRFPQNSSSQWLCQYT